MNAAIFLLKSSYSQYLQLMHRQREQRKQSTLFLLLTISLFRCNMCSATVVEKEVVNKYIFLLHFIQMHAVEGQGQM